MIIIYYVRNNMNYLFLFFSLFFKIGSLISSVIVEKKKQCRSRE